MIVEERNGYGLQLKYYPNIATTFQKDLTKIQTFFAKYIERIVDIRDPQVYVDLREELV